MYLGEWQKVVTLESSQLISRTSCSYLLEPGNEN